jgi:hypothetical protein
MADLDQISQKQFIVTLEGRKALFQKVTAPKEMFGEQEFNDGQSGQIFTHLDFLKLDKVTLTRNYNPISDPVDLVAWYQEYRKNPTDLSISVQPVKADLAGSPIPGSKTMILSGCRIVSFKFPSADREGSGMATLEIEVMPKNVQMQ